MTWRIIFLTGMLCAGELEVCAQSYQIIHNLDYTHDGAYPYSGLVTSGNTLYGTTESGGDSLGGTIFKLNTDGFGFTVLRALDNDTDGSVPMGKLLLNGTTLYGTASSGGVNNRGTVFAVDAVTTNFSVFHHFADIPDGSGPVGGLALSGNMLYGTTEFGGNTNGEGTIFKVGTNGTGYAVLTNVSDSPNGLNPTCDLIADQGVIYGTETDGGYSAIPDNRLWGAVFSMNTSGASMSYTNLKTFFYDDGAGPDAGLLLSGNSLYGTTVNGGSAGDGTIFRVNTDGSGFMVLYNFTNSPDGASPYGQLILSGSTLYGTTQIGGSAGNGTVFEINTNGGGYAVIKNFQKGADGSLPTGGLVLVGNSLFGTTAAGGTLGYGTIFKITLTSLEPCPLRIDRFGTNAVLTWTNPAFSLQTATQVQGTYTTLPSAVSPYTNTIGGTACFFRLIATP